MLSMPVTAACKPQRQRCVKARGYSQLGALVRANMLHDWGQPTSSSASHSPGKLAACGGTD